MRQPADTTAGDPVLLDVGVLDSLGNVVLTDSTTVIAIGIVPGTGTAGATLNGTTNLTALTGVAAFTNISPDSTGVGYQIEATSAGLAPDTSIAFTVQTGVLTLVSAAGEVEVTEVSLAGRPLAGYQGTSIDESGVTWEGLARGVYDVRVQGGPAVSFRLPNQQVVVVQGNKTNWGRELRQELQLEQTLGGEQ